MKLLRTTVSLAAACCIVFSSAYAAPDSSLTFTVNESRTTHDVDIEMYGVGSEWVPNGNAHLVDYRVGGSVNMDFVNQMKEQGFSMEHFRMAGVSSTGFLWKNSLGNLNERGEFCLGINSSVQSKPAFGVLEQAKFADAFNPGHGTISYTVNLMHETPSDMADLAEFYYGDGKKNYNGGINWAQFRIKGGFPNPVKVSEWEMGNEYDGGMFSHQFINYKLYVQKCKEVIGAIRSVKEDAPIALTAPFTGINSKWTYSMLDELGNEAQYYVQHGYIVMDSAYLREQQFLTIKEVLDEKFGEDRIKIVVTENNSQGTLELKEGTDTVGDKGWGACMYFGGGRGIADFLLRFWKNTAVAKTNLFATNTGTSYSMFYIDNDGKYKLNAAAMASAMFQKYGVGSVCESSLTGFEPCKAAKVSGGAVKTDDGINVILVNNTNDTDYFVNFDFEKKYTVAEKQTIWAKKNDAFAANYVGMEEIGRKNETVDDGVVVDGYTVPKCSIIALKLKEVR